MHCKYTISHPWNMVSVPCISKSQMERVQLRVRNSAVGGPNRENCLYNIYQKEKMMLIYSRNKTIVKLKITISFVFTVPFMISWDKALCSTGRSGTRYVSEMVFTSDLPASTSSLGQLLSVHHQAKLNGVMETELTDLFILSKHSAKQCSNPLLVYISLLQYILM